MPLFIGVEIGGTKLQAGLGSGDGTLSATVSVAAEAAGGREAICNQVRAMVCQLLHDTGIGADAVAGIGVGFGGPVDVEHGIVFTSHQVSGWDRFPLADWFREEFGVPVALNNDSDLAGLAEARLGAGRGCSPVVYMNIGSGIGGAIVVDGKLYSAQGVGASEIGHLRVRPPEGGGLEWPTLESLASGWSLARQAEQIRLRFPDSALGQKQGPVTTQDLVEAVQLGDAHALAIWNRAITHLGVAVANVITLLHPQRFVIGGGVALAGDLLFRLLRDEVRRHVFAAFRNSYEIVPAQLEQQVVVHGAILWARHVLEDRG